MKPILFSTPMVQAILEGRKTMTRRIIKPTPILHNEVIQMPCPIKEYAKKLDEYTKKGFTNLYTDGPLSGMMTSAPKYSVGDILYVREKSCYVMLEHAHDLLEGWKHKRQIVYATDVHEDWMKYAKEKYGYKWKPSLFMPKEDARIFLKVTDVRAEKLQDISWGDTINEGLQTKLSGIDGIQDLEEKWQSLWQSINGEQSWNDNPWVWVIKFEIEKK